MIDPKQIPDGVVDRVWARCEWPSWLDARDAIAAALNAWPGVRLDYWGEPDGAVLLPLPQEAPQERINQEGSDE